MDTDLGLEADLLPPNLDGAVIDDLQVDTGEELDDLGLPKTPEVIAAERAARDAAANDPVALKARIAALEAEKTKDAEIATLNARLAAAEAKAEAATLTRPADKPAAKVYTQAELDQMNAKLVEELSTNPLAALQRVREAAKADALAEMGASASPALAAAGQTLIDNFLGRMEKDMQPKWYKAAEAKFVAATKALDPAGLLTIDAGQRSTILQRFWNAAIGEVTSEQLRASAKRNVTPIRTGGAGAGGGGTAPVVGLKRLSTALGYTDAQTRHYLKMSFPHLKEADALKTALEAIA